MLPFPVQSRINPCCPQGPFASGHTLPDPLEEGLATHSSILSGKIPWTEEPGGLQSIGSQRVGQLKQLSMYTCHIYDLCEHPPQTVCSPKTARRSHKIMNAHKLKLDCLSSPQIPAMAPHLTCSKNRSFCLGLKVPSALAPTS